MLDAMSLRSEDREFQIEIARLQMEHQEAFGSLVGLVAIEFSVFGVFTTFALTSSVPHFQLVSLMVMIALVLVIFATVLIYSRQLIGIRQETVNLKNRFVWYQTDQKPR